MDIGEQDGQHQYQVLLEKYLKGKVERKWLEKYIINGDLTEEYLKPYKFENFKINE